MNIHAKISSSAAGADATDLIFAEAFRDLEDAIRNSVRMSALAVDAFEEAFVCTDEAGQKVFRLTYEDWDKVCFALNHAHALSRQMKDQYQAVFVQARSKVASPA